MSDSERQKIPLACECGICRRLLRADAIVMNLIEGFAVSTSFAADASIAASGQRVPRIKRAASSAIK
jgi:hypothetical protein